MFKGLEGRNITDFSIKVYKEFVIHQVMNKNLREIIKGLCVCSLLPSNRTCRACVVIKSKCKEVDK